MSQPIFPELRKAHADTIRHQMNTTGRAVLYLKKDAGTYEVVDFTETVRFLVHKIRHSTKHNIGKYRHDAWFRDREGKWWHGVSYGFQTTIIHCHRLKRKSRRM